MTRGWLTAIVIAAGLAATACAGGGTAPTSPTAVTSTPGGQTGAPANVTGTWTQNGALFMTLTQDGTTISGSAGPITVDSGGVVSVFAGTVTGTTSGAGVSLRFQNMVMARTGGGMLTCRGADSFSGAQSGDTLDGTLISSTTPYVCDRGAPMPAPQISGPITLTRP